MSPLSDSSSIDDISEPLAEAILAWERAQEQLAVATQQAEAGAVGAEGAVQVAGLGPTTSQTGAAEQVCDTHTHTQHTTHTHIHTHVSSVFALREAWNPSWCIGVCMEMMFYCFIFLFFYCYTPA